MLMLTEIQMLIIFFCFTLGAVLRTLWGFLWKWLEAPDTVWNNMYTKTMVASIVLTYIFAVTTFSTVELPTEWVPMVAFTFVTTGFTANSLFNDIATFIVGETSQEKK